MSLGVEDYLLQIERFFGCEQQIEILERLGKDEAVHVVGLLFRYNAFQPGVGFVGAAIFDEVIPHFLAHRQIFRIFGESIKIKRRLDDLWPQWVAWIFDLASSVIVNLWLYMIQFPHLEHRILKSTRAI